MGGRHHLYSHEPWFHVSCGGHGLAQPQGAFAFRLSNTLDADFCVEALKEAIDLYGPPKIFNTDQGAQFTSEEFTETLKSAGVTISMDDRGRATDNIFIERLWWTVKYHYLYLHTFNTGSELAQRT